MIDCLIIGYNETNFEEDVRRMKSMGTNSISYKDFSLGYINHEKKPYRALDILTHFYYENNTNEDRRVFHNADVLWQCIMYLGTYLNKNGMSFDYINLFHLEKDKLREKLEKENIRTIAITTTIYVSVHPILEVISFIKKYNKTAKIIVGGPYISKQCEEVDVATNQSIFKLIDADFYINSLEGEATLLSLIREVKGDGHFDKVDNIAYKLGDDYVFTAASKESNSLEDNMIDYSLFPKEHIGETVNVRTSKSCPFSCAYCGFPLRAEKYTYVTVERVEKELNALHNLGCVRYINFIDDTFNIPKERFKEILTMMIRNKYNFKWYSFYRADFGDEQIIDLMKKAGCIGVFLGVESANNDMLKRMNKTSRVEHYLKAIAYLKQVGIAIFVSTIIGFPGETFETAKETMDFIEYSKPDFFRPQIWWSDPLTPIWKKREEYGIKGLGFNWTHNTMDSKTAYDLFEKTFLSVENSIWVPDPGFNAYGMYYLLQRGMTMEQVKEFLRSFNAAVKEKIIYPDKEEISPQILEKLKQSCRFNAKEERDISAVEILPGSLYKEAEKYWIKEFGRSERVMMKLNEKAPLEHKVKREVYSIGVQNNEELHSFEDIDSVILASFSLTLSRLKVLNSVSLITADDTKDVIPMNLDVDEYMPVEDYLKCIRGKMEESRKYSVYALNIITSPERMAGHGLHCPKIEFGFLSTGEPNSCMSEKLKHHNEVYKDLNFIVKLLKLEKGFEIYIEYKEFMYTHDEVAQIGDYMLSILKMMSAREKDILADLKVSCHKEENWVSKLEEEEFNF